MIAEILFFEKYLRQAYKNRAKKYILYLNARGECFDRFSAKEEFKMSELCFDCFQPKNSPCACPVCGFDLSAEIEKVPSALQPVSVLSWV